MIQGAFTVLFIGALIVAALVLANPSKPGVEQPSVFKTVMSKVGLAGVDNSNKTKTEKFSVTVQKGIASVREQMRIVQEQRTKMMDRVRDQEELMSAQGQSVQDLMTSLKERQGGTAFNGGLAEMKELASAFEDQKRVLAENGRQIAALNEQMREKMERMRDQQDMADLVREQNGFADNAVGYSQRIQDVVEKSHQDISRSSERLLSLYDGAGKPALQDHVQGMLAKQRDTMQALRNDRQHMEDLRIQIKQRVETQREHMNELMEQNAVKMADARQKSEDQQRILKERIADQMEHSRDQNH